MRLFLAFVALALMLIPAVAYGQSPATKAVHIVTIYTMPDGTKVVVEESGDARRAALDAWSPAKTPLAAPVVKAASGPNCVTCAGQCDCGAGCACDEVRAKLAKTTAPRKYYLPQAEPAPVVVSDVPAWTPTAGGYYQGVYYAPMPATMQNAAPQVTYYSTPTYTAGPSYAAPVYGQPVYAGGGACAGGNCSAAPGGQAATYGWSATGPLGGGIRYSRSSASGK